ncbi:two-component system sensor histidine kinase NtrB [Dethiosulfatarculus sandiegensis]|uniref:histidine kinase n=1 Tax=Dethiosulfatarculus sandiegensis TaxID=1429043 RepID=A0A0D2J7B7_9BACT|nr:ATP-binding protein [Dethiosulfatarculus sandiegensis]KIX14099.1 hypothetical protein X474_10725 [Dethiosulfatarculus sandiegensis]
MAQQASAMGRTAQNLARDVESQRPFQLVRYFSVTSLIIILLFTIFISSMTSNRAGDLVLHKRERYALLLAENLNHQVIVRFVYPVTRRYGRLKVGEQLDLLDAVVRNTIHSFKVRQVNIIDLAGNIIYSTQPEYIQRVVSDRESFQVAAKGGHVSKVSPKRGTFELGGGPERVLKTYIPLRDERRLTSELGPPQAVFEITLDITQDFRDVWWDQMLLVGNLLLMMALLFIILRTIVTRGQRVIDRRNAQEAKLLEQLNQAERLASLGRMVAGVAHEIRNPLGIVRSTAELLGSRADPVQKPLAEVIVEESTRLNSIVTEFLDFARPQAPKLKPINLEQVLDHNLNVLVPEVERLNIELLREYMRTPVSVMGDADLLYRAFLNIFNNALQAAETGGLKVRVSTREISQNGRDFVVAAIEDQGPGFSKEAKASLFDPFFTTKEKGTGLGMSIVSNIVASHKGRVEVGDSPLGGAKVEVWLPVAGE